MFYNNKKIEIIVNESFPLDNEKWIWTIPTKISYL